MLKFLKNIKFPFGLFSKKDTVYYQSIPDTFKDKISDLTTMYLKSKNPWNYKGCSLLHPISGRCNIISATYIPILKCYFYDIEDIDTHQIMKDILSYTIILYQ